MSFSRAFQWYHSHLDLIWPDGTFNWLNFIQEANEKAEEIDAKAEEEFNIEKGREA